jgi:toxin-antitoxin system PIN domain toxin
VRGSRHLLDTNVAIALTQEGHAHYRLAQRWFNSSDLHWGLCPISESGFFRLTTKPGVGSSTLAEAEEIFSALAAHPGYRWWPILDSWTSVVEPFRERIHGHQQITDAYLLGLAIKENGILVTLDKAFRHLAGPRYARNLLVLE